MMTNFLVTTLNDEVAATTDLATEMADGGGLSLREALTIANALGGADTIDFALALIGGTTAGVDDGVITLNGTELVISSDVTINGDIDGDSAADITVSANDNSRVIQITGGTSTLDGLTVSDGSSNTDGSGVRIDAGSDVTISNSTIASNRSYIGSGGGGGIFNNGTLAVVDSTITQNRSDYSGGGIINGTTGDLTITGSAISNNTGQSGGGISNFGLASVISSTISNNTGSGNTGFGVGGGIRNTGTLSVVDSTLASNDARVRGGGISNDSSGAVLTLTNTSILNNYVRGDLSPGNGGGGGLYNRGSAALTNVTLSDNLSYLGSGGALNNIGSTDLSNVTIWNNRAGAEGGGIYNTGQASLANVTITANGAETGAGGGIANTAANNDLVLSNTIIAGNLGGVGVNSPVPVAGDISSANSVLYNGVNVFSQAGVGDVQDIIGTKCNQYICQYNCQSDHITNFQTGLWLQRRSCRQWWWGSNCCNPDWRCCPQHRG